MAKKPNLFSKKIQELTLEEFDFTEDFFANNKNTAPQDKAVSHLRRAALKSPKQTISHKFSEESIDENWLETSTELEEEVVSYDGQLSVDVFETDDHIVIISTVAGVRAEHLDIAINGDMLTIKGKRHHGHTNVEHEQYYIQECYWGGFSRSIILPSDVLRSEIEATLEHGVLTIRLPKVDDSNKIQVVDISER